MKMSILDEIILNLPEVQGPKQKFLSFKEKLKWTSVVLVLFFLLGMIPLWPTRPGILEQFEYLSLILGAKFGSLISLGIGPIVTGSIILQLLQGSGIFNMDLTTSDGKAKFQGIQKLSSIAFIIFESAIYVFMGGISPPSGYSAITTFNLQILLVIELLFGGLIVLFMDEIISKWGFGSGISLFIAAGISKRIFVQLFSVTDTAGFLIFNPNFDSTLIVGRVWSMFISIAGGNTGGAMFALSTILATVIVFVIAVYAQAMKVEIPLSFGRVRGQGIRWPLQFIYTSVMPIILVSSLFATMQIGVRLAQNMNGGNLIPIVGGFSSSGHAIGLMAVLQGPNLLQTIINNPGNWGMIGVVIFQSVLYILLMMGGSVLFSLFWVQTSGMDAESQAEQIMKSGLQIPGFRKDKRILQRLLKRYIGPLTVMGSLTVGFLAAIADLLSSLARGTGILLTVMIIYKLYEQIAKDHMYDMYPMMRKFMGK